MGGSSFGDKLAPKVEKVFQQVFHSDGNEKQISSVNNSKSKNEDLSDITTTFLNTKNSDLNVDNSDKQKITL